MRTMSCSLLIPNIVIWFCPCSPRCLVGAWSSSSAIHWRWCMWVVIYILVCWVTGLEHTHWLSPWQPLTGCLHSIESTEFTRSPPFRTNIRWAHRYDEVTYTYYHDEFPQLPPHLLGLPMAVPVRCIPTTLVDSELVGRVDTTVDSWGLDGISWLCFTSGKCEPCEPLEFYNKTLTLSFPCSETSSLLTDVGAPRPIMSTSDVGSDFASNIGSRIPCCPSPSPVCAFLHANSARVPWLIQGWVTNRVTNSWPQECTINRDC